MHFSPFFCSMVTLTFFPSLSLVIYDPDTRGAERVVLKNVSFDDVTLADWETKNVGKVEMPFRTKGWPPGERDLIWALASWEAEHRGKE